MDSESPAARFREVLDGRLLPRYDLGWRDPGGVGFWSKDDSVTLVKDFPVASK